MVKGGWRSCPHLARRISALLRIGSDIEACGCGTRIVTELSGPNRSDGLPRLFKVPTAGLAPRVFINSAAGEISIKPRPDDTNSLADWGERYLAAIGTTDEIIAEALFRQLLNVFHTEPGQPLDSSTANLALTLMHSIGSKDAIEAMLAYQMVLASPRCRPRSGVR